VCTYIFSILIFTLAELQNPIAAASVVSTLLVSAAYSALVGSSNLVTNADGKHECTAAQKAFIWCNSISLLLSLAVLLVLLQVAFWQGVFAGYVHPFYLQQAGEGANLVLLVATLLLVIAVFAAQSIILGDPWILQIVGGIVVAVVVVVYTLMARNFSNGTVSWQGYLDWAVFCGVLVAVVIIVLVLNLTKLKCVNISSRPRLPLQ
jgi:hypothetical protein